MAQVFRRLTLTTENVLLKCVAFCFVFLCIASILFILLSIFFFFFFFCITDFSCFFVFL